MIMGGLDQSRHDHSSNQLRFSPIRRLRYDSGPSIHTKPAVHWEDQRIKAMSTSKQPPITVHSALCSHPISTALGRQCKHDICHGPPQCSIHFDHSRSCIDQILSASRYHIDVTTRSACRGKCESKTNIMNDTR